MLKSTWVSLVALSFTTSFFVSMWYGRKGEGYGVLIGVVVALVVGIGNAITFSMLNRIFWSWHVRREEQKQSTRWSIPVLRTLHVVAWFWVLICGFLAGFATIWVVQWRTGQ